MDKLTQKQKKQFLEALEARLMRGDFIRVEMVNDLVSAACDCADGSCNYAHKEPSGSFAVYFVAK